MSLDVFEQKNAHAIYLALTIIEETLLSNKGCDAQQVLDSLEKFLKNRKKKLFPYIGAETIYFEGKIKDFNDGQSNKKSQRKK